MRFIKVYSLFKIYNAKIEKARSVVNHPLTLTEKILYAHLFDAKECAVYKRNTDYVNFLPDRVAMQDATAQMALLQLMNCICKNIIQLWLI